MTPDKHMARLMRGEVRKDLIEQALYDWEELNSHLLEFTFKELYVLYLRELKAARRGTFLSRIRQRASVAVGMEISDYLLSLEGRTFKEQK